MTTATIEERVRAAIFIAAMGLLPKVALADGAANASGAEATRGVPDHAAAEARGAADTTDSTAGTTPIVLDHATAEARSGGEPTHPSTGTAAKVPDHAAIERRGAHAE